MSTISVSNIADGDAVTGASINNQVNTIVNDYNGNITAANLASNAVTDAKITANNLLTTKFSNLYKFRAYRNAAFNATAASAVIVFDTKVYDTSTNFSVSTGLFTAPVAGFYWFSARSGLATATGNEVLITLQKNGADDSAGTRGISTNTQSGLIASTVSNGIQLAANDTVGVTIYSNSTTGAQAGPTTTYFSGFLISSI